MEFASCQFFSEHFKDFKMKKKKVGFEHQHGLGVYKMLHSAKLHLLRKFM